VVTHVAFACAKKDSTCGNFGHAAFACAKKEKKVWVPKGPIHGQMKITNHVVKKTPLDRVISKPTGGSKPKSKIDRIRLSNFFDVMGNLEKEMEEDIEVRLRTPTTFLEVFEKVVSSRDKGKGKLNASPTDRGFSPPGGI
jgi:hypothetical protein